MAKKQKPKVVPGRKRVWKYRLSDIAQVSGLSAYTVREHRAAGHFDPASLFSVICYVAKHWERIERREKRKATGSSHRSGPDVADK